MSHFERGSMSKRVDRLDHLWQHMLVLATERNTHGCRIHWRCTCSDAQAQMHDFRLKPKSDLNQAGLNTKLISFQKSDKVVYAVFHVVSFC
jgi:hypothetical protein